jgi:hypothetical protein
MNDKVLDDDLAEKVCDLSMTEIKLQLRSTGVSYRELEEHLMFSDPNNSNSGVSPLIETKLHVIQEAFEDLRLRVLRQSMLAAFALTLTVLLVALAQIGVLQTFLSVTAIGVIFSLAVFFLVVSVWGLIVVSRQTVSSNTSPEAVMRTVEQELSDNCSRALHDVQEAQVILEQTMSRPEGAKAYVHLEALRQSIQKFASHVSTICATMGEKTHKRT